jgi:YgiT-type zinc finger domain-containing protein
MQASRKCQSHYCHGIRNIGEIVECEFCGGKTRTKNVKRQHWLNKKLYIVENVQAEVCTECGERYFHAKTLDALDKYLSKQHVVKEKLDVEVVSFNQAMA